jgi:hypothetical protein
VHWQDVRSPGARKHLVTTLSGLPDFQTISVVLCKWHLKNVHVLTDPAFFYHSTARLLIERLSWFGKSRGDVVSLVLAQVKGHPPSKVHAYLKKLGSMPTSIEWAHLKPPPAFGTPKVRRLLQLADTASGAVFAAFEPDLWGYTDQSYIDLLKPAMWRPPGRALSKYGLKVGPWPDAGCAAEHGWLPAFYK